jgi:hypothetical protein
MKLILALAFVPIAASAQVALPFNPGRISMPDSGESFGSLSPDSREFYYTIHNANFGRHRITVARIENGQWTRPATVPFSGRWNDREPRLSPDGKRLYFSSNRPLSAGDTTPRRDLDLWMAERAADGTWGAATHLEGVNGATNDFSPVVTGSGVLYFITERPKHNVWRARPTDKSGLHFSAPENVGTAINTGVETNVFVSPDERMMLISRDGAPDGLGGDDIYVAQMLDGAWQPAKHLDAPVNTDKYEYGPALSPDGKSFFFTSWRGGDANIYRMDSGILERSFVERAVRDYLEGFYEGDTAKLVRTLRPEMFKYGFFKSRDSLAYSGERMTYDEAIAYARGVKERKRPAQSTAPREIVLFDVQNETASAKVTAWWGTDYLLLGKYDGRWMISHVLWQGP